MAVFVRLKAQDASWAKSHVRHGASTATLLRSVEINLFALHTCNTLKINKKFAPMKNIVSLRCSLS